MAGGQSASLAQGTAAPAVAIELTGLALTLVQESLQSGMMGQTVTASTGTATPSVSITLTGQSLEAQQGVLTLDANFDTYLTASQGTATPVVTVELTGQSLTAAQGTIEPGAATTNIDLTGQELTAGQGSLSNAVDSSITGLDLTSGTGTLTGVASGGVTDIELSGQVISAYTGVISPNGGVSSFSGGGGSFFYDSSPRKLRKLRDDEAAQREMLEALAIEHVVVEKAKLKKVATVTLRDIVGKRRYEKMDVEARLTLEAKIQKIQHRHRLVREDEELLLM